MENSNKTIAIIGGGVIGQSWTTLFASKGTNVVVFEPNEEAAKTLKSKIIKTIEGFVGHSNSFQDKIHVVNNIEAAVKNAYAIQECGPEKAEIKQSIFADVEKYAPQDALIISSSSGIVPSVSGAKMKDSSRLAIGHPVNPPHAVPLIEVIISDNAVSGYAKKVMDFYTSYNKIPVRLKMAVPGFVVNRLQTVLVLEAVDLIAKGVVSVKEMDTIVTTSLGIRWGSIGPMLTGVFGGGDSGLRGILEHIMNSLATSMGKDPISEEKIALLEKQANEFYPKDEKQKLVHLRDQRQNAIIEIQKKYPL